MAQVAECFNRFYNILLRQHLQDPTLHSEWLYFLSMFKSEPFDQPRVDLYLNILVAENKKKLEFRQKDASNATANETRTKSRCHRQPSAQNSDLSIEKKMSENLTFTHHLDFKNHNQPLPMRKAASNEEDSRGPRHSLNSDEKAKKEKKDVFSGIELAPTTNLNQYFASLGLKHLNIDAKEQRQQRQSKLAERSKKLKEISARLLREFQPNVKLRA